VIDQGIDKHISTRGEKREIGTHSTSCRRRRGHNSAKFNRNSIVKISRCTSREGDRVVFIDRAPNNNYRAILIEAIDTVGLH
jgi:hypothetical protein